MTTVYDVPPKDLINAASAKLKKDETVVPPEWSFYVKTGTHREKAPVSQDWWYERSASVLRKVYMHGPIGVEKLAAEYGGAKDRGSKPDKAVKGSRAIIRQILQQLDKAKMIETRKAKGRIVTPLGQSFLDNCSREVMVKLAEKDETFKKFL